MNDLIKIQRDILYVLAGMDKPHGLAIKSELQQYYNQEVNHGRLYPNLDTLVDKGLAEKGQQDKRTNYYALTDEGHAKIEARREWEAEYAPEVLDD